MIARVLPNVSGLDRTFDYAIPVELASAVEVGTIVRVDLHGRRVGGWVVEIIEAARSDVAPDSLKPITKVTGLGPSAELFDLAAWASVRWASGRLRPFLVTASPPRVVTSLPRSMRNSGGAIHPTSPATASILESGGGVLRLPPRHDVVPAVLSVVEYAGRGGGSALVVAPSELQVAMLAIRLRRAGLTVAVVPAEWAAAAGGVDVVIGARSAAWAPCADLAAAVVVDEHDEALQEERSPTWHARDVVVERCRRAGAAWVLVSPIPTLSAVVEYAGAEGVVHPERRRERAGWPAVRVIDRTNEEPWKRSLVTSEMIEQLRVPGRRVACVSNITGRARLLACRHCSSMIRCEACDAAVGLDDDGRLACRRCGTLRPPVCQVCGHSAFANLRPGVSRLREELEAAANRPVALVTASSAMPDPATEIVVGTEAVLHRVSQADVVVFLEFDSEMLAPRFRASEQALALIVRAGRIAPEVMVQTFVPDHEVLRAACAGDPDKVMDIDRVRREQFGLPPFGALARVSGPGADAFTERLREVGLSVGPAGDANLVRAPDWRTLGERLGETERPAASRVRVEIDPARV